jgi:hypothetical protein
MKKLIAICTLAALLTISATANAALDWHFVPFDSVIGGALSYDAAGNNVVVDGSAFKTALGDTLSTQKIGGDGINNPVTGNFAFFGGFNYTDNDNVFAWAQSIMDTPLAIEIGAHTLNFGAFTDYFALDARDMEGVDYLTASFAQMAEWGCTEIAPDIWMDIAVDTVNSQVAISIVIDGFYDLGENNIDTYIIAGDLDGEIPGQWRASGIYLAPIPEPATIALLAFGSLAFIKRKK